MTVNIGLFYESCVKIVENSLNNTYFTAKKKASNTAMSMSVSQFINFHELRCHCFIIIVIILFRCLKVLKVLVNNREITLCIPKLGIKQIM